MSEIQFYAIGEILKPYTKHEEQHAWIVEVDRFFDQEDNNDLDWQNIIEVRGNSQEEAMYYAAEIVTHLNGEKQQFKKALRVGK